jgi:hypothetical protein
VRWRQSSIALNRAKAGREQGEGQKPNGRATTQVMTMLNVAPLVARWARRDYGRMRGCHTPATKMTDEQLTI